MKKIHVGLLRKKKKKNTDVTMVLMQMVGGMVWRRDGDWR